jgi:MFS family permease
MRKALQSFLALFSAVLLLTLGTGLLGTLLSVRMAMAGIGSQTTGLVMSMFYAGLVLGSFATPRLVQEVGHIRAFAAFAALTTVCVMGHALAVNPVSWAVLRLIAGIAVTGNFMVVESWLNACTASEIRSRVMAIYMTVTYLGYGSGQFLLNLRDVAGTDLFLVAGMLITLCLIPVALTRSVNPQMPPAVRFNLVRLYRMAPFSMFGCLTAGAVNGALYTLGPVFALGAGLSLSQVTGFMGITILGGLALQWPVGSLSDRFDRLMVMAGLCLALAAASAGICLAAGGALTVLLTLTGLYGGIAFTLYPVAVARAHDKLDPAEIVPISAALILFYGIGAFIGPIAAAGVMARVGPGGLYLFIALIGAAVAAAALLYRRHRPRQVLEQARFVAMPRTSPVASAFDPRLEPDAPAPPQSPS